MFNKSFLAAFNRLEDQRQLLLEQLSRVPAERLHASPSGKWSVVQILTHLLTSEKMSVGYMYKKSLGIETLPDSGIRQQILLLILKISQRIPVKYKAPKVIVENTPEALPLPDLVQQWNEVRTDLKNLVERIDPRHRKRLIFKHPIAGRFNAQQAVEFMYEHVDHHLPQIKNLLKP